MQPLVDALWSEYWNLTPHQKRVVFLAYWHNYTEAEIGAEMGLNQSSIHRAVANAVGRMKKNIEGYALNQGIQSLIHVGEKNGKVKPGGQAAEHKIPGGVNRPISLKPHPETYLGSPEREEFLDELAYCCASAALQCYAEHPLHEQYDAKSALSRQRIDCYHEIEARRLRRRVA